MDIASHVPWEADTMKNRRLKMILIGMGLMVFLVIVVVFLQGQQHTASSPAQGKENTDGQAATHAVQVLKPKQRDMAQTLTLPANISPWYQATIYAKAPGFLKWVGVDKGDEVKEGQLLATIDAPEIKDEYQQAVADYEIKRITAERLYAVWKENPDVVAKQDVDVAQAAAEGAKHLRDNRREFMNYTKVYAPFSGTITARFVDPGAFIQSGMRSATQSAPLFTIMDMEQVRVYVSVPQEGAYLAKPGVKAMLTVAELPGEEFKGSITRTTEALDPATRTLLVEIDMPNKERKLRTGTFVTATLYLQERPNALAIPPAAIVPGKGKDTKSVFVIDQGKAHLAPIKTGIDDGIWVEVVDGLTGSEDIVVVGKGGLSEGQAVTASDYNLPEGKPARQKI